MNSIQNIKGSWDSKVPTFRSKVSNMLNSSNGKSYINVNPFLDKNGDLVNPYIDYQQVLDNSNISAKVKTFISQATGLSPSVTTPFTQQSKGVTVSTAASDAGVTPASFVPSEENLPQSESSIAAAAKNYIGTPYVWGGESMAEGGMDCSGFVYNALRDAGYNVGRTTAQGYRNYGTSVSKSDMLPGDLIFFGKNGNASHIGIYLGNGQMIHSSGGSKNTKSNPGKGVSITNVDYRSDFLEARRY